MNDANASHLAPVLTVRSEGDVKRVVQETVGHGGKWAAGEDEVMSFHDLLGKFRRGDNNCWGFA